MIKYIIKPIGGIGARQYDDVDDVLGLAKSLLEQPACKGIVITKQHEQNPNDLDRWSDNGGV